MQATVDTYGGLDILVNNSGGPPRASAAASGSRTWRARCGSSSSPSSGSRASASRYLRKSETGRIVNITSSTVREPIDNLALSNVVRPGVVGWAKSLARELGPDGITVNCIAPGRIDTERIREVYPDGPSDADLEAIPLRRLGTTREIGDVVAFLCSERAAYVSGTVILVDGALTRGL